VLARFHATAYAPSCAWPSTRPATVKSELAYAYHDTRETITSRLNTSAGWIERRRGLLNPVGVAKPGTPRRARPTRPPYTSDQYRQPRAASVTVVAACARALQPSATPSHLNARSRWRSAYGTT